MDLHALTVRQNIEGEVAPEIEAGEAGAEAVDLEVDHVTEDREADHVTEDHEADHVTEDHEADLVTEAAKMVSAKKRTMCSLSCSEWQYMNRRGGFNRPLDYVQ